MFEQLFSIISDAALLLDSSGTILRANRPAENLFGYPGGTLTGQMLDILIPELKRETHRKHIGSFLRSLAEQRPMGLFRVVDGLHRNGESFQITAAISKGEYHGQPALLVCIQSPEKSQTELPAEQTNQELFSKVLGAISNLVLVSNSHGEIVYVNPAVQNLLGYSPEELLGDGWWNLERISGGDIQAELNYVCRAAAGEFPVDGNPYEHRLRHKDGSWRTFLLSDAKGPANLLIGIGADITAMKHSENLVREKEILYQTAISAADAVPYNLDYQLKQYTFIGEEIERITGYSREELTPALFDQLIQESTMRGKFAGLSSKRATELVHSGADDGIWHCDFRIRTKSGESRWLSDTSIQVRNTHGQLAGSIGILQDVTARKQVEMQLQHERDMSAQVMNAMGQGLTITNQNGRFIYVNPAYAAILGCQPDELLGKSPTEFTFAEDHPLLENNLALRQQGEISTYETRLRRKDGSEAFALITGVPRIANGNYEGSITVITDLTERLRMEKALRASEESIRSLYAIAAGQESFEDKLQLLLQMGAKRFELPMGILGCIQKDQYIIVALETETKPLQVGDMMPLAHTYSRETLLTQGPLFIQHASAGDWKEHPCYQICHLESYLGTPVYSAGEVYGVLFFASLTPLKHPLNDSDKDFINLIAKWIGNEIERLEAARQLNAYAQEIQNTNRDLAEARDRALEASYLKSAFLATMSHEIRTPMNAIIGMTELLLETELDPDQHDFARAVNDSGHALLTILNDILDFSKIEAGKLVIKPEYFHLGKLVKDVVELFRPKALQKNIQLEYHISPLVPPMVLGDSGRIRQVLNNFISNAIKFTEKGGVFIQVASSMTTEHTVTVTFTIEDTGIGIPTEIQSKLFQPFTQADGSITRRYGGTGLGLAISQRLVSLMEGETGLTSSEGKGSRFWFSIPMGYKPSQAILPDVNPPNPIGVKHPLTIQHKPLLVVEDQPLNRNLLLQQLNFLGFKAQTATTGQEAIQILGDFPQRFSLILMDINMPEMDGLTATKIIRQRESETTQHIPIIALTANAFIDDRENYLAAGMDDYLAKPLQTKQLKDMLEKWLSPADT